MSSLGAARGPKALSCIDVGPALLAAGTAKFKVERRKPDKVQE